MSAGSGKARSLAQLKALVIPSKVIKRRHTSIRLPKVSRPVDGSAVTIERLDEHTHTRDIEGAFGLRN